MLEFQVSLFFIFTNDNIMSYAYMLIIQNASHISYMRMPALRYNAHRKFKFGERM